MKSYIKTAKGKQGVIKLIDTVISIVQQRVHKYCVPVSQKSLNIKEL
jgi:hypothetical protein